MRLAARDSITALPRAATGDALALDVACGQGRHASALRGAGYRTIGVDVSWRALEHARAASAHDADLLLVEADLDDWPFAPASFDVVVQIDFLERRLFPLLVEALRPRGLLLLDTFLDTGRPNREGPSRSEFLLRPGELETAFPELEVIRCEESAGETARALLLARKPGTVAVRGILPASGGR